MTPLQRAGMAVLGLFIFLAAISTVGATLAALHFWLFLRLPANTTFETRQFFIPPKTGAHRVAGLLESKGVIRDARSFYILAWLKKSLNRLQAGEYAFSTASTPEQILDQIINGRVVIHSATLPEGSTLWDVARILDQKDLASGEEFLQAANDQEFIQSMGLKARSLEGYLFPETYFFKKPISSAQMVKAMAQQFWHHLPGEWPARAKELGRSLNEIVTIASMVEKEAVVDSERPIIAGVFYNRLKINMPLQSDPTAVYDIPNFSGPVTAGHLSRQSPYNTYHIKGLPPGPICNPGAKSLMAALYPGKVPYIYFVSNNDGTHRFSVTAEEHRKAVSSYYDLKKKAAEEKAAAGHGPSQSQGEPDREPQKPEASEDAAHSRQPGQQ